MNELRYIDNILIPDCGIFSMFWKELRNFCMDTATGSQNVTLGAIVQICYVKEVGQKRCSANLTLISVQFYICCLNFITVPLHFYITEY